MSYDQKLKIAVEKYCFYLLKMVPSSSSPLIIALETINFSGKDFEPQENIDDGRRDELPPVASRPKASETCNSRLLIENILACKKYISSKLRLSPFSMNAILLSKSDKHSKTRMTPRVIKKK